MSDVKPVCTTDEARAYFKNKGLTYNDITEGDIAVLLIYLKQEIKKSNEIGETSVNTMYMSRKIDMKKRSNGSIIKCFLYINSHYFTQRECISFNENGFIGFCGWADTGNTNPILRAFLRWCDTLADDEPRLYTAEELQKLPAGTAMVVEQHVILNDEEIGIRKWGIHDGQMINSFVGNFLVYTIQEIPFKAIARDNIHTTMFRFWNKMPTNEQSKGVKWDAE